MSRCAYIDAHGASCPCEATPDQHYCSGCKRLALDERRAFDVWMERVVLAMEAEVGLHPDDLPDCAYADWHATGMEPEAAVRQAIALCAGEDLAA